MSSMISETSVITLISRYKKEENVHRYAVRGEKMIKSESITH
jgi:hypothetical protein